jgi:uncharacterized protein (TIGR03000 family)
MSYSTYNPTMNYAGSVAPAAYGMDGGYVLPEGATSQAARPATLVVTLPADARLTVDNTPTRLTSARRVFNSPPLQPGRSYRYTLKAEIVRDGQTLTTTRDVNVRAGQETDVNLEFQPATASVRR